MRSKFVPPDPEILLQRAVRMVQNQPRLVLVSYGCGLIAARLAIHDFHKPAFGRLGFSAIFAGAAIVLYVLGLRQPAKRQPRSRR